MLMNELIEAIATLAENANLRVSVTRIARGAFICSAMSGIGGFILGPPGLAIGGTLGGLTAYMTSGTFRPVAEILINDLTEQQQKKLLQHIKNAVVNFGVSDLALLIPLMAGNIDIQRAVLGIVISFVKQELKLKIID